MSNLQRPSPSAEGHHGEMICISPKLLRGKSGLSRVELALLAYVYENPESTESRATIAEDCCCVPNSLPRAAKKLIELGLIARAKGRNNSTVYRPGRNMEVTVTTSARNVDATSNIQVTSGRIPEVTSEPKRSNEINGRNSEVTTPVDIPPTPPYKNITPLSKTELNPETPEPSFERGPGKTLFGDADAPKQPRRKAHPKFVATDDTLPREITPEMERIATERGMVNGTRAQEFADWRRWHIDGETVMTFANRSWTTWVKNWAERKASGGRSFGAKPSPKLIKRTRPDGSVYYDRNTRTNTY